MVFANFGGGPRGIALVEAGSNSVTVLKSDGAGGFTAMPTPTTSGTSPSAIAVWYPDHLTGCLAVTYAGSRNVNLLYGFGDGTFALGHGGVPLTTGISTNPRAVTLDDINGDGISDLLVANNSGGASTSVVNVLLGASNGSFGSVGSLSGFTEPGDILLADVTGDTKPDLIAVSAATNTVSAAINIGPYVAASLALSAPSSSVPNTPFQLSVTARDKFGNIATGYRGTIHFTGGGAGATFPPDYTFTASDNGFHTFTVTIAATGSQTITASDTVTVTPPNSPTFTLTGATSIYVIPQPASTLVVTTPASVAAGTSFSFTVTVQDTSGNTVTDFEGAVQFTSTDSLVSLPGTYGFTNTDQGTHTFTATMHTAGSRTLSATMVGSPGVTSTATITVTGPNITGITPASGPANGGVTFTIRGSGFTGATSVMFGGVNAATFTVTNDTTMTGTTPTNQPSATVDVTVTTPQGVASFHGYTFLPASVAPLPAPKTTQANTSGGPAPDTIPQRRP
jgi:hypothetical protein